MSQSLASVYEEPSFVVLYSDISTWYSGCWHEIGIEVQFTNMFAYDMALAQCTNWQLHPMEMRWIGQRLMSASGAFRDDPIGVGRFVLSRPEWETFRQRWAS
jgi:hypothetical protein